MRQTTRSKPSSPAAATMLPAYALKLTQPGQMFTTPRMRLEMTLLLALLLTGFYVVEIQANPAKIVRSISSIRTQQCREGCIEKFATKETLCQQTTECLTCWDECAKSPPPKINKSIRETWSLHTVAMLQQDSLVLVDVAWTPLSTPNQCLVTWEVSGGGLMGNLLTESFNVQLSLWPDTKYRVQVTCKNKLTGLMSRSLPLTIDTAEAAAAEERSQSPQQLPKQASTTLLPLGVRFPEDLDSIDSTSKDISSDTSAPQTGDQEQRAETARTSSGSANKINLPYDEQSAETISQHTNFVFDWHQRNSDISAIEPLNKPDLNLLTIAALSQLQKPLIFGVVAGTLSLALILLIYACVTSRHRPNADKVALITDDIHSAMTSLPAGALAAAASGSASATATATESTVCKHAAMCTRNALKV